MGILDILKQAKGKSPSLEKRTDSSSISPNDNESNTSVRKSRDAKIDSHASTEKTNTTSPDDKMRRREIEQKVIEVIHSLKSNVISSKETIGIETSLIENLEFTSIEFVDLTLALETALDISEFPMQRWIDNEILREDNRFTVGSLVDTSLDLLSI